MYMGQPQRWCIVCLHGGAAAALLGNKDRFGIHRIGYVGDRNSLSWLLL
jgi:hypothetical protein